MVICIDFDGTCVTHEHPKVGKDIGAVNVLKMLVSKGNKLILNTMRKNGPELDDAVNWFTKNGIDLYGINHYPTQSEWTDSPKAYGELYIDDRALGIPLKYDPTFSNRPYVDWDRTTWLLWGKGLL